MRSDKEKLKIVRKKLRTANKTIEQYEEADKERVKTIQTMFNKLKQYWEYKEAILTNWTIFTFLSPKSNAQR